MSNILKLLVNHNLADIATQITAIISDRGLVSIDP